MRRIEGTTGLGVLERIAEKDALIESAARELKTPNPNDIAKKAAQLQGELKTEKSKVESLEARIANEKLSALASQTEDFCGLHLSVAKIEGLAPDAARSFCDEIRAKDPLSVVLLGVINDGRLNLICSVGKEAQNKGMNAGSLVRTAAVICGGGGGGRPDSATAGGKNPEKLQEAFAAVKEAIAGSVKA